MDALVFASSVFAFLDQYGEFVVLGLVLRSKFLRRVWQLSSTSMKHEPAISIFAQTFSSLHLFCPWNDMKANTPETSSLSLPYLQPQPGG